uniref:F-box domain-containing protein n=1 Tax=Oryza meridionalis TaxID=40149 RepID=A0A0E0EV46_9ORYZ
MGKLRRVGGEGNDLISELNDDVLVRVLDSLPTMADVARACAASRRWRHLSTRVPSLRFGFTEDGVDAKPKRREKFYRFVAFVNHVLDARAASAGIEQLAISIELYDRGAAHAVAAWIRYVMRHAAKSLALDLHLPEDPSFADFNTIDLDDLSMVSRRLETMTLSLAYVRLRLPAAATATAVVFDSLVDLSFKGIRLVGAGADSSRLCAATPLEH